MAEVTRTNPNALRNIAEALTQLDGHAIKAGWDASAVYESGMPVAQIMAQNEFGLASRSIPARPTARPTVKENKPKWDALLAAGSKEVLRGNATAMEVMQKIGEQMQNDWLRSIVALTAPALSPITLVLRKFKQQGRVITGRVVGEAARLVASGKADVTGVSTKPLNDTGFAISTLTHIVEKAK